MADDTLITGTTVGDISYVVAYYDVNTGNLYDANGNMYGNSTLTTTLDNEFILELHYVQDISTSENPEEWAVWGGLEGKTVDSSLAFDSDYKHAYEGASTESTAAASHEIKITVSSVDKDTLNSEGNLIINPYGLEPEQIPQGSTSTPRMVVPYDSFEYVSSTTSGTVFKFHVADPDGLMYAVPANIQVRVSDPLYLYINPSSIYEVNIPPRYNEGVFKFPMNIMSRKLLKALDYTGVSGVVGTLEHKISVRRDTLTGVSYNSNTYTRDKDKDSTAVYSGDTFLFCAWVNGSSTIWTKGNDVQTNTAVYSISNGTATLLGSTANPVTETDSVLFRTFAFPFLVKNLIDYNATIDIPMQDVDWAKDYIISIIKNNMEEVTGKASTGAYGVVKIANDGTIDVDDGVISIATSLATKQDNMSATAPVAINNSTVSLNVGDGLDVGVTGTTNANKLIVNEASVKEVLEDVVDGGTEPAVNEIVTADNLKGALSVGQAVDVSCLVPTVTGGTFVYTIPGDFLGTATWNVSSDASFSALGYAFTPFPKFASGLKYLWIADLKNIGQSTTRFSCSSNAYKVPVGLFDPSNPEGPFISSGQTKRAAYTFEVSNPHIDILESPGASIELSNCRQYEVTALTDEAIAYIAQLENPDDFFRSTDVDTVLDKYLVKQDMVCPFIPTIEMSNSDLTVAAGLSYKMTYKSNTATMHTITADTIPTLAYGWDTHLQLFVDDNTTVNFQYPLVLEDPLTPNAGHNMTIKWRNGQALAYVDDRDVGYIVTVTAGTDSGSLYYGLANDVGNYIVFSNTTDGVTIIADSVIGNRTVNLIGNGLSNTILSSPIIVTANNGVELNVTDVKSNSVIGITCDTVASTKTAKLLVSNVFIDGATAYRFGTGSNPTWTVVGNAYSKNTKVTGSTFTNCSIGGATSGVRAIVALAGNAAGSGVFNDSIMDNSDGIGVWVNSSGMISGSTFSNNLIGILSNTLTGGGLSITNCLFEGNNNEAINDNYGGGAITITGSTFATPTDRIQMWSSNMTLTFSGTNILNSTVSGVGNIAFADGAVLKSTDRTGIINFTGSTHANCFNDAKTYTFDGLKITGGVNGAFYVGGTLNLLNCLITGNTSRGDYGIFRPSYARGSTYNISGCTFSNNGSIPFFIASNQPITINFENVIADSLLTVHSTSTGDCTININNVTLNSNASIVCPNNTRPVHIRVLSGSSVSVPNNTASAKVLQARTLSVGSYSDGIYTVDGSATFKPVTGSVTLSGIGTYINADGTNDFENIRVANSNESGEGSLSNAISTANKFVIMNSGVTGTIGSTAVTVSNKNIVDSHGELIIGGSFSLAGCTIDEITKTVNVNGGSITISSGGKLDGKTINCNEQDNALVQGTLGAYTIDNIVFTGSKGRILNIGGSNDIRITGITASNNSLYDSSWNYLFRVFSGSATFTNCLFIDNVFKTINNTGVIGAAGTNAIVTVTGCTFGLNQTIGISVNTGTFNFTGTNVLKGRVDADTVNASGTINLADNSVLDLRGNPNTTVLATSGAINIGSSVSIIYDNGGTATAKTATINNTLRCTGIGNDGSIKSGVLGFYNNNTFTNCTFSPTSFALPMVDNINLTFTNCYWHSTMTLYCATSDCGCTITFTGTNKIEGRVVWNGGEKLGNVVLAPNTTLDYSTASPGTFTGNYLVYTNGTLTIGAGCKVILFNGTLVYLNQGAAGSWSNASIKKDGSIDGTAL